MATIENITSAANIHRNTILQGDCLTILPTLPARSADFILTDPPYITPLPVARLTHRPERR